MPSKSKVPNPFYALLILSSTLFVMTVFAYLLGPTIHQQAMDHPQGGPSPVSRALADWLDRRGPLVLAVEFGVMLVSGILAMLVDRWPVRIVGR